jgi:RimJ/RimL family protein N-acetyltransferase
MAEVLIREAVEGDIPAILDVLERVAEEEIWIGTETPVDRGKRSDRWDEKYFGDGPGRFFVVEADGSIIGYMGVHNWRGLVELGMAIVDGHRGMGLGSRLLQAGIDWATAQGAHKITLQVWPHNEPAIALYEKFGFEHEGHLRRHYPRKSGEIWGALIMGLQLEGS